MNHQAKKSKRKMNPRIPPVVSAFKNVFSNIDFCGKEVKFVEFTEANNCETSETTNNTTCEANSATKLCDLESKYEETVANWQPFLVPDPVLKALTDLGFTTPTTIQRLTLLSAIRDRKDIVGAAETVPWLTIKIILIYHMNNILMSLREVERP